MRKHNDIEDNQAKYAAVLYFVVLVLILGLNLWK